MSSISSSGARRILKSMIPIAGLVAGLVFMLLRPPSPRTVAGAAPQAAAPAPSVEDILARLPQLPDSSLSGKALRIAMEQTRRAPRSAQPWLTLGDVLAQGQRETADPVYFGHAEICYRQALKCDPLAIDGMSGLAWVHGGRHQFDLSILWAEKALGLDPDHPASHGIIGDAAVETGDYDKAFGHYQKMMDLRPDLSSLSRGSWLLWLTGNQTRAVLLMEKAIASGGPYAENTAWCRARLALMLFHDGALEPAAMALQPALAQGSRHPHVLLMEGKIAAARAEFETAVIHYQTVLGTGPNLEALIALGDIFAVKGDGLQAAKYYAEVEALHRSHRERGIHDHMEMARFYADHDRDVAEGLRLALEHGQTGNPAEADTLAWLFFKNGNQGKAVEWIKRALEAGHPDASTHYHAGCIAAAAGDRVSAEKHLQQALSRNPHFSLTQAPQAAKLLEELGRTAPDPPPVVRTPATPPSLTRLR